MRGFSLTTRPRAGEKRQLVARRWRAGPHPHDAPASRRQELSWIGCWSRAAGFRRLRGWAGRAGGCPLGRSCPRTRFMSLSFMSLSLSGGGSISCGTRGGPRPHRARARSEASYRWRHWGARQKPEPSARTALFYPTTSAPTLNCGENFTFPETELVMKHCSSTFSVIDRAFSRSTGDFNVIAG